ncbi:twinfilin-2-B-like protein [Euroglyphus maynei]|uniref:Twinfilin-2-B-like protein n=1 Tax=Euroglyphus maynei TaxID=6958 RepID=A0A1Y3AQH4_EURMA|nr:twinfilin-2-B-like protein [Euroglyphus maynei]
MVAASTKATLKNSFGSPLITMDLFIEDFDDLSVEKIFDQIQTRQHDKRQVQTIQELEHQKQQELEIMHKIEHCNLGRSGGALHFNCLLDQMAEMEVKKFQQGHYCCIRFIMSNDFTKVVFDGKLTLEDYPLLSKRWDYKQTEMHEQILLPEHFQPGYIVFRFRHFNPLDDYGESEERFVMVSYVPIDNTLPAKLRFSYSVNLNSMVEKMNDKLDNQVKYFEAGSLDEITVLRIFYLLYPSLDMDLYVTSKQQNEMIPALKFDKPTSRGRGPRRMIR